MKFDLTDSSKEKVIVEFEEKLASLKERCSELRKTQYDTSLIDIFFFNIKPKIKMARATYTDSDIEKVREELKWLENEISLIERNLDFPQVLEKVTKIYDYMRNSEFKKASKLYDDLRNNYRDLDEESKSVLYQAGLDIYEKLTGKLKSMDEN